MDLGTEYKRMANTGLHFRGLSVVQHADQIHQLILDTGSKTLLDWGCGGGDQYREPHMLHKRWGVEVKRYDPNFAKFCIKPNKVYDGVICTDVLEHLKENRVDELIGNLFRHARRFVFASVCCRPATKTFGNGRNVHVTIRPFGWWYAKFIAEANANSVVWSLVETP